MGTELLMRGSLREILGQIGSLTDEAFICAGGKPNWTGESPAYVIRIPEFADLRLLGPMPDYFLEVFVARDVLEGWSHMRGGRRPTLEEICEGLIYYALHDAHIPLDVRP